MGVTESTVQGHVECDAEDWRTTLAVPHEEGTDLQMHGSESRGTVRRLMASLEQGALCRVFSFPMVEGLHLEVSHFLFLFLLFPVHICPHSPKYICKSSSNI